MSAIYDKAKHLLDEKKPKDADLQFELVEANLRREFRALIEGFEGNKQEHANNPAVRRLCFYYLDVVVNRLALNDERLALINDARNLLKWLKTAKSKMTPAEIKDYDRLRGAYRTCRAIGLYNLGCAKLEAAKAFTAEQLKQTANLAARAAQLEEAIALWERSIERYRKLENSKRVAELEPDLAKLYEQLGDDRFALLDDEFDVATCHAAVAVYQEANQRYLAFQKARRPGGWLPKQKGVVLTLFNLYQKELDHYDASQTATHDACLTVVKAVEKLHSQRLTTSWEPEEILEIMETRYCCARVAAQIHEAQGDLASGRDKRRMNSIARTFVALMNDKCPDYAIDAALKAAIVASAAEGSPKARAKRNRARSTSPAGMREGTVTAAQAAERAARAAELAAFLETEPVAARQASPKRAAAEVRKKKPRHEARRQPRPTYGHTERQARPRVFLAFVESCMEVKWLHTSAFKQIVGTILVSERACLKRDAGLMRQFDALHRKYCNNVPLDADDMMMDADCYIKADVLFDNILVEVSAIHAGISDKTSELIAATIKRFPDRPFSPGGSRASVYHEAFDKVKADLMAVGARVERPAASMA